MELGFEAYTLLTGVAVFLLRIVDVSLGTIRTISTVQGRTRTAFLLGFVEVSMWLAVIAAIVPSVAQRPILGVFYALGFSTGNVVGILIERKLAFGHAILRVITPQRGEKLARALRNSGHAVTCFEGTGRTGPVLEVCAVCRRKDLKEILGLVGQIVPDAFYVTEPVGMVRSVRRPTMQPPTGWRAVLKKK
ncbi:MAG: DUF2179 domain-containing protein [Candidatus Eisenbacteria bacterium]|nr:DUF2179 domain-containing protein [Candidatus Eisenbacteria bacterium]